MSRLLCCRQDALSASTALHSQVEKLKGELATESTAIVHLRQNVSAAAQQEAQTVAQLQGQVCPALRASWMQAGWHQQQGGQSQHMQCEATKQPGASR